MKKSFIIGTIVVIFFQLITACQEGKVVNTLANEGDFIYLDGNKFMLNDSVYFPILVNYLVEFMKVDDQLIPVPNIQYDSTQGHEGTDVDSYSKRIDAHFKLIKKLGLNSIRLVGLGGLDYNENSDVTIKLYNSSGEFNSFPYSVIKADYIAAVVKIIELAKSNGLKVMILLPTHRLDEKENESRISFIKDILSLFKDENTVFSYDFFNEPLYFDNSESNDYKIRQRSKESAYNVVKSWDNLMKNYAPNQLSTIGFGEPIEVFEWDASLLPVDFVSFHTYHPLRVPNEIYWWSKYINKPWMITEVSLPSDNDSISYNEQRQFMYESFKRTVNCGGSGFGWWQFQDVDWGDNFEHNYTSLIDHNGVTFYNDSNDFIYGTPKPAALAIKNLVNYVPTYKCDCAPNYYNMLGYKNIKITGRIVDGNTGVPIEGAVIRGWTNYWNIASNTFTNHEGVFNLYSNDEFIHFEISAPGFSKIKFDQRIKYTHREKNVSQFTTLNNKGLEYHSIHYQNYLKEQPSDSLLSIEGAQDSTIIFNVNPSLFDQFIFSGPIGTKMLFPLDFENHE